MQIFYIGHTFLQFQVTDYKRIAAIVPTVKFLQPQRRTLGIILILYYTYNIHPLLEKLDRAHAHTLESRTDAFPLVIIIVIIIILVIIIIIIAPWFIHCKK